MPEDPIQGVYWSRCPTGELRNPLWLAAVDTVRMARVSPLCAWPDSYPAGLVDAVLEIRAAEQRAAEREVEELQRRWSSG